LVVGAGGAAGLVSLFPTMEQRLVVAVLILIGTIGFLERSLAIAEQKGLNDDKAQQARLTTRRISRLVVYGTLTSAVVPGVAFGWLPLSTWYARKYPDGNVAALLATSAIGITSWGSSLIAFSIQQRLPKALSFGFRFVLIACFASLLGAVGNSAVLRSAALLVFAQATASALISFRMHRALKNGKISVATKLDDPPEDAAEAARLMEKGKVAMQDVIDKVLDGGPYWALIALCALLTFILPSQDVVLWAALVLLVRGIPLCFAGIIEPFAPQFGEEFWKRYLESRRSPVASSEVQDGKEGSVNARNPQAKTTDAN
jgi:hypothetical protein